MQFIEIYTDKAAIAAAIKAAINLIGSDECYPREGAKAGVHTGLVRFDDTTNEFTARSPSGEVLVTWMWAQGIDDALGDADRAEFIRKLGGVVRWTSGPGDWIEYDLREPGEARVRVDRPKHSPCWLLTKVKRDRVIWPDSPEWSALWAQDAA